MSRLGADRAYLVRSDEDHTVLLALDAKVTPRGVEWFDTVRDRGFVAQSVDADGEELIVRTARATYRFTPLTIELYRERVKGRVDGQRDFASTDALQRFYRRFPR